MYSRMGQKLGKKQEWESFSIPLAQEIIVSE